MVLSLKFFGSFNENYWLRAIKPNVYIYIYIRVTIVARSIKSEKKRMHRYLQRSLKQINDLDMFLICINCKRHASSCLIFYHKTNSTIEYLNKI